MLDATCFYCGGTRFEVERYPADHPEWPGQLRRGRCLTCDPVVEILWLPPSAILDEHLEFRRAAQIGTPKRGSWSRLCEMMRVSRVGNTKLHPDVAKRARGGWGGGRYRGNRRHGSVFIETWIMTVDVDEGGDVAALAEWFKRARLCTFIHSTYKSVPDAPRARVAILLSAPCTDLKAFAAAHAIVREMLRRAGFMADDSASDCTRLNFLPMHQEGVDPSFAITWGSPLDLRKLLATLPSKTTPKPTHKTVADNYRAAALRRESEAVASAREGDRHNVMRRAAWALSRPELGLTADDVRAALLPVYHDPRDGETAIRGAFQKRQGQS